MNYPTCCLVTQGTRSLIVAVTSGRCDELLGRHWTIHDPNGELLSSGFSSGSPACSGARSALTAMTLGKRVAKRLLSRTANQL